MTEVHAMVFVCDCHSMKAAVMELSAYLFETLHEDGEFILHRGQRRMSCARSRV